MYSIDLSIFRFFNSTIANPVFDLIFPFITKEQYLLPIYLILLLIGILKGGRKAWVFAIVLIIGVALSDPISSKLLKGWIERPRPCHTLDDIRLLIGCGAGKSWPSSHAFNNATAAFILAYFYPKFKYYAFSFAGLVAFSRVYVGVHYPFDIFSGFILGLLLGWIIIKLLQIKAIDAQIQKFINGNAAK